MKDLEDLEKKHDNIDAMKKVRDNVYAEAFASKASNENVYFYTLRNQIVITGTCLNRDVVSGHRFVC
jgi:hypothetical protein